MYNFMKPNSVTVRYGTTIATCGRIMSNFLMMGPEPIYASLALSSNATGLTASHTKAGVTAESGLAFCALTALATTAVAKGNPLQLWMAGIGMIAFGNAFLNNVRYTKLCPKSLRKYEGENNPPVPPKSYEQQTNNASFGWKDLSPVTWLRKGAKSLAQSSNEKLRKFGEDAVEISQRKMFAPGITAMIGVTPFIVDGIQKIAEGNPEGWKRTLAGTLIFASNAFSMLSIPQKQKHPILALWHEITRPSIQKDKNAPGMI